MLAAMTSTTAAGPTAPATETDPAQLFPLRAAVLIAPIGPLAIGLARGFLSYNTTDEPATIVDKIMTHPGVSTLVLWLAYLAILTLPLGVLIAGRAAIRARPILGTIAATLAWLGFLSLFAVFGSDAAALAAHQAGSSPDLVVRLITAADTLPPFQIATIVFVAGHILGCVLLGIALWRVIPRWAALALAVSQPLHLLFAILVTNHWADAAAWSLTAIGFTAAALATLRQHTRSTTQHT